jgi:hypothetical protein
MTMRKHCTMAELLGIRDGEGTAWARSHVDDCRFCRQELDLLYQRASALRALPAHRPPRDRWPVVRDQVMRERRGRVLRRVGYGSLAMAAAVALLLGIRAVDFPTGAPSAGDSRLTELMTRSQELEATLRSYGTEGRVLSGRAAGIIADLEDRIALVDAGINQVSAGGGPPDQLIGLWQDRVDLMDALVSAHVTRAAYVGF